MTSLRRRDFLAGVGAVALSPWSSAGAQTVARQPLIVDAHVHIWSGGKPTAAQRQEPFSKEQLLAEMTAAGVQRAILVPTSWDPQGNQLALEAARSDPERFAVMGLINIAQLESRTLVAGWKQQPGMLGIRLFLATPQSAAMLADGSADWFWSAAETAGLPLMIHAGGSLPAIGALAERHPGLKLCVDSLGAAPRTIDAAAFADIPKLLALAKLPNVSVKAEGVSTQSSEPYPHRNLHAVLRQVFDAFGPERLFWGSDLTRLKTPYRQSVTLFTQELAWLSDRDRELIMGRAVCNWAGWAMPA
jgi:predicted TIM-barrel fold metal-dependent hydrolase